MLWFETPCLLSIDDRRLTSVDDLDHGVTAAVQASGSCFYTSLTARRKTKGTWATSVWWMSPNWTSSSIRETLLYPHRTTSRSGSSCRHRPCDCSSQLDRVMIASAPS